MVLSKVLSFGEGRELRRCQAMVPEINAFEPAMQQRSDAELVTLAGQHIHAHNTDYNLNASLGIAYGVTHRLSASAELPYIRRDDLREGSHVHSGGGALNGVEPLASVAGIGDNAGAVATVQPHHGADRDLLLGVGDVGRTFVGPHRTRV